MNHQRISKVKELKKLKENLGLTYRKTLDKIILEYPLLKKENNFLKLKLSVHKIKISKKQ